MKISAHLEFDTFGEAEKVFRHLGMLDAKHEPKGEHVKPLEVPKTNGAHPTQSSSASGAAAPTQAVQSSASEPTLDDVKDALRAYIGKAGGRTAGTGREILLHHGVASGRLTDLRPEQYPVLKRAFETAGPDMPLGEAA